MDILIQTMGKLREMVIQGLLTLYASEYASMFAVDVTFMQPSK